jgi:AcrR family transcriptional regulator
MPKLSSKSAAADKALVLGHKHGRVPRVVREKQILDIAEKQFIEKGYEGTTVESVRLEAGVSRPIIYDHFGSKDDLYLACVKRTRSLYTEQLAEIWKSPDSPLKIIKKGSELFFGVIEENPERWLVLFSGWSGPKTGFVSEELLRLRQETIDLMVAQITQSVPFVDFEKADAFSNAMSAVGEQLGHWWLRNPDIPKERVVEHNLAFITGGLAQLLS